MEQAKCHADLGSVGKRKSVQKTRRDATRQNVTHESDDEVEGYYD